MSMTKAQWELASCVCGGHSNIDLALPLLTRRQHLLQPQTEFKGLELQLWYFWATRLGGKLKTCNKFARSEISMSKNAYLLPSQRFCFFNRKYYLK